MGMLPLPIVPAKFFGSEAISSKPLEKEKSSLIALSGGSDSSLNLKTELPQITSTEKELLTRIGDKKPSDFGTEVLSSRGTHQKNEAEVAGLDSKGKPQDVPVFSLKQLEQRGTFEKVGAKPLSTHGKEPDQLNSSSLYPQLDTDSLYPHSGTDSLYPHSGTDSLWGEPVPGDLSSVNSNFEAQVPQKVPLPKKMQDNSRLISGGEYLNTLASIRDDKRIDLSRDRGVDSKEKSMSSIEMTPVGIKRDSELGNETKDRDDGPLFSKEQNSSEYQIQSHFGGRSTESSGALRFESQMSKEVTANVVPGANAQARISTDGLMGISAGIKQMNINGGGTVHIRLKPEHLGELSLRVVMDGSRVGLKIQASDEKAKKILEDSMDFLRESLSNQSLVLGQVDLTVASSSGSSAGNQSGSDKSDSRSFQGNFQSQDQTQQGWSGNGSDRRFNQELSDRFGEPVGRAPLRMPNPASLGGFTGGGPMSGTSRTESRLDVRA